uniref:Uncharacterized protein n=1 Tax=Opuntia streptacantha TaxID=393608 RepID=A0A7C8ZR23_OPUST
MTKFFPLFLLPKPNPQLLHPSLLITSNLLTLSLLQRPPPSHVPTITNPSKNKKQGAPEPPAMRLMVPLQGVVQGRGGLILGSIIPCALFYFFQLYLKKNRCRNNRQPPGYSPPALSPTSSNAADLNRSSSRLSLSAARTPARISARASGLAAPNSSAYYVGLDRGREDPYHEVDNPNGIIQLGMAENRVSFFKFFFFDFFWVF